MTRSFATQRPSGYGTSPIATLGQVRWEPALVDASPEEAVAAWRHALLTYARRLEPNDRAKFYLTLESALAPHLSEAAAGASGGVHPQARLTGAQDFFASRVRPSERVIDLGCGNGVLSAAIAEHAQARVIGVDWDEASLGRARALAQARKLDPMPSFACDDLAHPTLEEPGDVLVLCNTLEYLEDRPRVLRRWLERSGAGRVLLRVPAFDRDWRVALRRELGVELRGEGTPEVEFTRGLLEHELGQAGLTISECLARWGEYWVLATRARDDEGQLREPRDQAGQSQCTT